VSPNTSEIQRVVVAAKLKPGAQDAAAEILRDGPPYDLDDAGLLRHGVYLGSSEAIFFFEGHDVENHLRRLLDNPAASAVFSVWGPLLEGTPSAAHELFYWKAARREKGRT
jgi:hypothetical protein